MLKRLNGSWLLLAGVFFACYYFYLLWVIDPQVISEAGGLTLPSGETIAPPLFFRGAAFLHGFLDRPGGPAEYAAAYLIQFFHYAAVGPFILTAAGWALFVLNGLIADGDRGVAWRVVRFVPPLLLLLLYAQYTFNLVETIAYAFALLAASGYLHAARRMQRPWPRWLVFASGAALTYFVAAAPLLLYVALCVVFEMTQRRPLAVGVYLLTAAAVAVLGATLFRVNLPAALFRLSGMTPDYTGTTVTVFALLNALPLLSLVALSQRQRLNRLAARFASRPGVLSGLARRLRLPVGLPVLALVIAAGWIAWRGPDRDQYLALRRNFLARRMMWNELLDELRLRPPGQYSDALLCDVNRALFETGRLSSEMFAHPQRPGGLFRIGAGGASLPGACEVLLQLGGVNEAEHTAHEALEIHGERPATLRQLALVNVAKGRPEAACIFLRVLAKDIIHGAWATDRLRRIAADPTLADDAEVCRLRERMVQGDSIYAVTADRDCLLGLLEHNAKNRMAFEYLLAHCLIHRQPALVAAELRRLGDLGYADIPPVYAEAFLLDARVRNRPTTIPGYTISPEVVARVDRVMQLIGSAQGDRQALDEALAREFPMSVSRYLLESPKEATP